MYASSKIVARRELKSTAKPIYDVIMDEVELKAPRAHSFIQKKLKTETFQYMDCRKHLVWFSLFVFLCNFL